MILGSISPLPLTNVIGLPRLRLLLLPLVLLLPPLVLTTQAPQPVRNGGPIWLVTTSESRTRMQSNIQAKVFGLRLALQKR